MQRIAFRLRSPKNALSTHQNGGLSFAGVEKDIKLNSIIIMNLAIFHNTGIAPSDWFGNNYGDVIDIESVSLQELYKRAINETGKAGLWARKQVRRSENSEALAGLMVDGTVDFTFKRRIYKIYNQVWKASVCDTQNIQNIRNQPSLDWSIMSTF